MQPLSSADHTHAVKTLIVLFIHSGRESERTVRGRNRKATVLFSTITFVVPDAIKVIVTSHTTFLGLNDKM